MARATQYAARKISVLREIEGRARQHSRVPTVRELAACFDISPATMHSWLTRLGEEGLVEWTVGRHRSLRCTPQAFQLLSSLDGQSV